MRRALLFLVGLALLAAVPSHAQLSAAVDIISSRCDLESTTANANGSVCVDAEGGTRWTLTNGVWIKQIDHETVVEWGAVCDGTTDDTAAITAAFTAAGSFGLVKLPPGQTCAHTGIQIPSPNQILDLNNGTLFLIADSATHAVRGQSTNQTVMGPGFIDGNRVNQTTGNRDCVRLNNDGFDIRDVTLTNCNKGFASSGRAGPIKVRNIETYNTRQQGIFIELLSADTAEENLIWILGNYVDRQSEAGGTTLESGIYIKGNANNTTPAFQRQVLVSNNHVRGPIGGTHAQSEAILLFGYVGNATITGNTTSGMLMGVSCNRCDGATVSGNTAEQFDVIGFEIVESDGVVLDGNFADSTQPGASCFSMNEATGVVIQGGGARNCEKAVDITAAQPIKDVVIDGLVIQNVSQDGVRLSSAPAVDGLTITNLVINGVGRSAFRQTSTGTINNFLYDNWNVRDDNPSAGNPLIHITQHSNGRISNMRLVDESGTSTSTAIRVFNSGGTGVEVLDNKIVGFSGGVGVDIDVNGVEYARNRADDAGTPFSYGTATHRDWPQFNNSQPSAPNELDQYYDVDESNGCIYSGGVWQPVGGSGVCDA